MKAPDWREQVVKEALSWNGTRYHHAADVKGHGVDCAFLLVRVYVDTGLAPPFDPRPYAAQWWMHRDEERYLGWLAKYAHQIPETEVQSADIAMFKFGRCVAHGAIILNNQSLIHAYQPAGCVEVRERSASLRHGALHSYWSLN